jgi:RNA polymerase sigma-70 factor (ECF subfamily)
MTPPVSHGLSRRKMRTSAGASARGVSPALRASAATSVAVLPRGVEEELVKGLMCETPGASRSLSALHTQWHPSGQNFPLSQFPQTATGVAHFRRSCQVQVVRRDFGRASDADLLRAGTADAFEEVYDRHAAQVLAWSRARVGEHAADLTAEVFARAWLGRSRFRHESGVSALPWLLGIARNVLRESLRKRRVEDAARRRLGMPLLLAGDAALDAIHDRRSLSESELRALASLPERDRELLQLRVIEERPYRDIAVRLRCTPQAARHRVSRLLRQLQCTLGGQQP